MATRAEPPPRYHLSGQLGPTPALVVLGPLLSGSVISYIAGRASVYVDSTRYIFTIGIVLGLAVGYTSFWIAQKLKCRNRTLVLCSSTFNGLISAWLLTVGLASEYLRRGGVAVAPVADWRLAADPALLLNTLDAIANAGVVVRHNSLVSPGSLLFGWLVQALIVFGTAAVIPSQWILRQVFCEDCDAWLEISRRKLFLPCPPSNEMLRIKSGDMNVFLEQATHRPIHSSRPPFMRIDYVLCDKCGNTGAFRIVNVTATPTTSFLSTSLLPWWLEKNQFKEYTLTPLLQLTPEAAQNLGMLQARDKESKESRAPSVPTKPMKPLKPSTAIRPKQSLKRPPPKKPS